ncbi:MAG: VOC family protein [Gomphosphaeria aponina SAG 52.96 = DSM 107014]|uniref:VOC family protein n=1 Tax=Gomphosphaeria aponina SAG 52.96 = DSM 107014 TaxID=1521640 RepID=A0A941JTM0_9CHRO|nr:VOC family protein [Gomphosphaeria aponina SAG 52.96 = DSM 107014]
MSLKYQDAFVALGAINFDLLINFYGELLGEKPDKYIPNVYGEFKLTGLRLGIFKPKENHLEEFGGGKSGMSLCLEVDDLEEAIAFLTQMGYAPPGKITIAAHGKEIYAFDPEGNRLILHQLPTPSG